jgi:hypothetical protein
VIGPEPRPALGIAAAALACVGCADDRGAAPSPAPTSSRASIWFESGTRLRARYYRLEGGERELTGWFDTELGALCEFASGGVEPHSAPDGVTYCLPVGTAVHRADQGPFADAACTAPLALSAAPASFVTLRPLDACASPPSVHAAKPSTQRLVYFLRSGRCEITRVQSQVSIPGDAAPLSTFVSAREEPVARDGARIVPRARVATDGSREIVGAWDNARGIPTRAARDSAGSQRWAPSRVAFVEPGTQVFADGRCTARAAKKSGHSAVCPLDAVNELVGVCGVGRFSALGPRIAAPFTTGHAAGVCTPEVRPEASQTFAIGAPIPDDAFAEARVLRVGGGPVASETLTAEGDVRPVTRAGLYDTRHAARCGVARTSDGSLRCVPGNVEDVTSWYTDAACVTHALVRPAGACSDATSPEGAVSGFDGVERRVYALGAEADALYLAQQGACVNVTIPHGARVWPLAEIPLSELARAEEVEE